jgi:WD40 repeat protein
MPLNVGYKPLEAMHRRWCGELGASLCVPHAASASGFGAFERIGALFANLGPTRWAQPRVVRLLPTNSEVGLAPPADQRCRPFGERKGLGVTYSEPYRVTWSRDGKKLLAIVSIGWDAGISAVTISVDRFVEAWDIPSGKRYPLTLPKEEWTAIAWHPEGRRFATASRQGVQVWDLATSAELVTLSKEGADHVVWSDDGQYLLAVKEDKRAAVYTPEGQQTCAWSALGKDWAACSVSGAERCVATGGEDGLIHVRDVETGQEVARWKAHDAAVTALTFSPSGRLLVSGAGDGSVRVWDIPWIRAELAKLGLDW